MKRSKFIEQTLVVEHRRGIPLVEAAANVAERAGVQWDPEEPEPPNLPRVRMHYVHGLVTNEERSSGRDLTMDEFREVAARCNAITDMLSRNGAEYGASNTHISWAVQRERDRLR